MRAVFAVGAVLMAFMATPVMAGGWAVTTLDALPADGLHAGQSYTIGYTIRQHGETPFSQASPVIRAQLGDQTLSFPGRREGAAGHYVSSVEFPMPGEWTWTVDQDPFGPQQLGVLSVATPVLTPEPMAAPSTQSATFGLGLSVALAAALAVLLIGWRPLAHRT
jgi:hypothetical protein